jgi:hypothetical protein
MIVETEYYSAVAEGEVKVSLAPAVNPKETKVLQRSRVWERGAEHPLKARET